MNLKPIIANRITIGVDAYPATAEEDKTVRYALITYGFLIRITGAVTRYSFEEFANAIETNYSTDEPRNEEIVRTLRTIHERLVDAATTSAQAALSV